MIVEIFRSIIDFLKITAPMSIVFYTGLGITLLIVGIIFLKKQQQTQGQKIGGWICVTISALAFLGAVSNLIFTYVVFA